MRPWTDLKALAVAIQLTKSRADAAALVATWRAPKPIPEPRSVDFLDEEQDEAAQIARTAEGARRLLAALGKPGPVPRRRP